MRSFDLASEDSFLGDEQLDGVNAPADSQIGTERRQAGSQLSSYAERFLEDDEHRWHLLSNAPNEEQREGAPGNRTPIHRHFLEDGICETPACAPGRLIGNSKAASSVYARPASTHGPLEGSEESLGPDMHAAIVQQAGDRLNMGFSWPTDSVLPPPSLQRSQSAPGRLRGGVGWEDLRACCCFTSCLGDASEQESALSMTSTTTFSRPESPKTEPFSGAVKPLPTIHGSPNETSSGSITIKPVSVTGASSSSEAQKSTVSLPKDIEIQDNPDHHLVKDGITHSDQRKSVHLISNCEDPTKSTLEGSEPSAADQPVDSPTVDTVFSPNATENGLWINPAIIINLAEYSEVQYLAIPLTAPSPADLNPLRGRKLSKDEDHHTYVDAKATERIDSGSSGENNTSSAPQLASGGAGDSSSESPRSLSGSEHGEIHSSEDEQSDEDGGFDTDEYEEQHPDWLNLSDDLRAGGQFGTGDYGPPMTIWDVANGPRVTVNAVTASQGITTDGMDSQTGFGWGPVIRVYGVEELLRERVMEIRMRL